ncbi:hypothetical protein V5799_031469 [Amblyomma americanum]|uniref:Uncharacterized protein n=1 Tax=Amblyomma americanum TaxID=6943 RepID=A0AAQ4EKC7_AMBAM
MEKKKKIALYTTCRRPNHPMSLATPMNRMLPTPLRSRKRSSVDPGPTVMRSSDMVSPMPLGASSAALLRGRQLTAGGRHSMTASLAGDMGLMWRGGEEESTGNAVEMFVGDNWSLLLGLAVWVCSFVLLALVVFLVYPAVPDTQYIAEVIEEGSVEGEKRSDDVAAHKRHSSRLMSDYASTRPLTPMLSNSSSWVPRRATPFLLNVLSLRALSAPFLLGALTRPVPAGEKDAMLHLVQQRLTEPLVKLQRNAVGVPLGALTPLLFHEDFPAAVRFAGLGRAFVDAALRVVGPEGEFYDQKGQRVRSSWWTEKSHESFRNATRCLGLPGSEELWRAALSVRLSWDVFRARRVDDRVGGLKTGLPSEGDADRLFFVAYCFFLCAREERPERPSPRDLCNVPLRNMADFAEVFNCSASSNMALSPRCLGQDRGAAPA